MKKHLRQFDNRKRILLWSAGVLVLIGVLFAVAAIRTTVYNRKVRSLSLSGDALFCAEASGTEAQDLTAVLSARSSTWTKIIDLAGEGLEEPNYQAYTYDFCITNESGGQLCDYTFRLRF